MTLSKEFFGRPIRLQLELKEGNADTAKPSPTSALVNRRSAPTKARTAAQNHRSSARPLALWRRARTDRTE